MMAFVWYMYTVLFRAHKKPSKDRSFGILNNLNQNRKKKSDRMQIKTLHVNKQPIPSQINSQYYDNHESITSDFASFQAKELELQELENILKSGNKKELLRSFKENHTEETH